MMPIDCISIANGGGISTVIAAIKKYVNNAIIQEKACAALWNLSVNNDTNRISIANAGGIVSLIAAMNSHVNNTEIQEKACGTLC